MALRYPSTVNTSQTSPCAIQSRPRVSLFGSAAPGILHRPGPQKSERGAFVNGNMLGLVALDQILRLAFCGVMNVTFESHIRNDFLHDDAANSAGL